jgi:transposase
MRLKMRTKKYIVKLTDEQKEKLNNIIDKGIHSAREIKRAKVLLLAEQNKEDNEVAQVVGYTTQQVQNIRKRFFIEGFDSALKEKPRPGAPCKLDRRAEEIASAIACSNPPEGRSCWTMQMIADKLVELKYVSDITDETVRFRLKKKR